MFRMIFHCLLVTLCFAGTLSFAKESGVPGIRALLLVPGGPVIKLRPMSGDKVGTAVMIGARGLSESFKPTSRKFSLAVSDAKKESGFRAVAEVALPEQGKDFIILLEPVGATYKVHLVNGRESRFGADCVLFFNASKVKLGATLGATKVLIKPRVAVFAKAPRRGEKPYYQVTFYEPEKDKARPFSNTRWPHRDGSRSYVFFYRNQATGRIAYQAVDESLGPVASAE